MVTVTLVQVLYDEAERTEGVDERLFDRVEDRDRSQHEGRFFYYLELLGRDVDSTDLWSS